MSCQVEFNLCATDQLLCLDSFVEFYKYWLLAAYLLMVKALLPITGKLCMHIFVFYSTFCSRLFHLYTYFFLFYNALVGLGRALRRVFTSAVVNLFFLPRLDRSLLIKGLDSFDKGKELLFVPICTTLYICRLCCLLICCENWYSLQQSCDECVCILVVSY